MSGVVLLQGAGAPDPHYCEPPGVSTMLSTSVGDAYAILSDTPEARALVGTLWRCECGRYLHCTTYSTSRPAWQVVSERKAQRILRRARR